MQVNPVTPSLQGHWPEVMLQVFPDEPIGWHSHAGKFREIQRNFNYKHLWHLMIDYSSPKYDFELCESQKQHHDTTAVYRMTAHKHTQSIQVSIIHYFNIYSCNSWDGDISITICEKHKLEFGCFVGCQEIVFVICNPNLRLTVVRIQFVSVSSPILTYNPLPFTASISCLHVNTFVIRSISI